MNIRLSHLICFFLYLTANLQEYMFFDIPVYNNVGTKISNFTYAKVKQYINNKHILAMALSSSLIQGSNSPSTPSTLRALTTICWWQRTAASLSPCGGWQAPHCLRLSAQACLETTRLRSAFSLTSLFPTRDSTSLSPVRMDRVLQDTERQKEGQLKVLLTVLSHANRSEETERLGKGKQKLEH